MSLEQTAELYASVLRQLLPDGVYDTAEMTHVADDIYAHAKALAQADIDAHRLLRVLETIPVDLLADYEREYGLPMQCMVPGSQTIEERISVLRWIRQHRNVMNREYLEQILAIFGVTLVDVVKHYPMQCMAPCNSPVNTERLRYKVLLRLQYPMTADMSCIIESYLPGYLRVEWVVDMPWGEWIINPTVTVNTAGIAHYTAYKTNQREYYDSYADIDLTDAIVKSLSNADMQTWQAVKDAINALIAGNTGYEFDIVNKKVRAFLEFPSDQIGDYLYDATGRSLNELCALNNGKFDSYLAFRDMVYSHRTSGGTYICKGYGYNWVTNQQYGYTERSLFLSPPVTDKSNTFNNIVEKSFNEVAQKILSNTLSTDQGISLLAEAYIKTVAQSLFNADESKQFVKSIYLIPLFDLNKTLRT